MKPPAQQVVYEKVNTSDFVTGTIEDIVYDMDHTFKGFGKDEDGNPRPDTKGPAVRLVFLIEGYKYPHKTPFMKFSYSVKANLYKKYISSLVEGAKEYMDFDMEQLKGMKVKMLWKDNGEFQAIETIRPVEGKVMPLVTLPADEEKVPF